MLTWYSGTRLDGMTSLRALLPTTLALADMAAVSGQNPTASDTYYDPENGYDGWELFGNFNGQPFSIYTRWGCGRIGGSDTLDVAGLIRALEVACGQTPSGQDTTLDNRTAIALLRAHAAVNAFINRADA